VEDFPNEIGSTSSLNRDISAENSVELSVPGDTHLDAEQHWEMNYHEAAIFLEVCSMSYIGTVCVIFACKTVEHNGVLFIRKGKTMKSLTPTHTTLKRCLHICWCITDGIMDLTW
jgi:hypothetical protein